MARKLSLAAWRTPFKYAVKVLAFSLIWVVVGMIFMFMGMVLLTANARRGPPILAVSMILFAIGYLIIYGGMLVAIFRYLPEALAEKIKGY